MDRSTSRDDAIYTGPSSPQSPAPLALSDFLSQLPFPGYAASVDQESERQPEQKSNLESSEDKAQSPALSPAYPTPSSTSKLPIQSKQPGVAIREVYPNPNWLADRKQLVPGKNQGGKANWIFGWSQGVSSFGGETYCGCTEQLLLPPPSSRKPRATENIRNSLSNILQGGSSEQSSQRSSSSLALDFTGVCPHCCHPRQPPIDASVATMVDDKKPSKLDKLKDKMGRVFGRRENHDDGSNKNDPPIQEPPPGHVPPHLRANANSNVPPEVNNAPSSSFQPPSLLSSQNNQAQQNLVWQTPIVQGFSPPARRKGPNTRVQEAEATGRLRDSIPADYTSRPEEYHPALHGAQTTSTSILEQNKRHGFYGSPEKGKSIMRAEEKPMPKPLVGGLARSNSQGARISFLSPEGSKDPQRRRSEPLMGGGDPSNSEDSIIIPEPLFSQSTLRHHPQLDPNHPPTSQGSPSGPRTARGPARPQEWTEPHPGHEVNPEDLFRRVAEANSAAEAHRAAEASRAEASRRATSRPDPQDGQASLSAPRDDKSGDEITSRLGRARQILNE